MKILNLILVLSFSQSTYLYANENQCDRVSYKIAGSGGDKGNGGFRDSEGTGTMLRDAQSSLLQELAAVLAERESKIYGSENCRREIDLKKLNDLMVTATYNPDCQSIGVNTDGINEERWFRINSDGHVEATKRFFDLFHGVYTVFYAKEKDSAKKAQLIAPIREGLIHEALHEFGYNQQQAKTCAADLISTIESYNPEKLKELNQETEQKNNQLVVNFLYEKDCLTEAKFQEGRQSSGVARNSFHPGMVSDMLEMHLGRQLLICIAKNGETRKADPMINNGDLVRNIGRAAVYTKSRLELARYLRANIKFSFEIPTPTKK